MSVLQQVILTLVQSMVGAISDNFRMVTIEDMENVWEIVFYLQQENDEDREAISEIIEDFDTLIWPTDISIRTLTIVTKEELIVRPPPGPIAVFMKRQ